MAEIIPFKAIRPPKNKAALVATGPYLSYSKEQLKEELQSNPYSFLQILKPNFHQQKTEHKHQEIHQKYQEFIKKGILKKDKKKRFYIYRQIKENNSYTGLIAGVSVQDYKNKIIKPHENILEYRKELFANYLEQVKINSDPVLLTYTDKDFQIKNVLKKYTLQKPAYEFATADKAIHFLWIVQQGNDLELLKNSFKNIQALYIADGHHRAASSVRFSDTFQKTSKNKQHLYFMAFLLEASQLKITSFHRLIKDFKPHTKVSFLKALQKNFVVKLVKKMPLLQSKILAMYMDKNWYELTVLPNTFEHTHTGILDVTIFSKRVLSDILGIENIKNSNAIAFTQSIPDLQEKIDNEIFKVGFCLNSITFAQIKNVADNEMFMPAKSTFIAPKLRNGLIIYPYN